MPNRNVPTLAFLITGAVLVGSVLYAYRMGNVRVKNAVEMATVIDARDKLATTLSHLKDAETGERGFIITGDEQYLEPYQSASTRIIRDLESLNALAGARLIDGNDLSKLRALIDSRLTIFKRGIEAKRTSGTDTAAQIVRLGQGKVTMDAVRELIATMTGALDRKLAVLQLRAEELNAERTKISIGVVAVNLLFLTWAYTRVRSEIGARELAAAEVWRQKELLAVTLSSIGDGVIVTDVNARVVFMNTVAEKLTGHSFSSSAGRPSDEVFKIINETSRQPVASPVQKVLEHGAVVGLANHTLLLRPDGSELPIDDSGAPVRARDGEILGVVLVFRDFTEHKAAERAIIEARDSLESANRAKDRFLATLSHELRTPLTPVLATLTAWEETDHTPPTLREELDMFRRNLELEARLIDDLLDLNRIIKGKIHLDLEQVNVHTLVQAVTAIHATELEKKRIELELTFLAERSTVRADSARLQQVLWNVFKNAIKFTPPDGRIAISTGNDTANQIVIRITDTGMGMTRDLIERLFIPFEQGESEQVQRAGGLGLGMAIARSLTELHGGKIEASSDGPGHGSTFSISFPIIQPVEVSDVAPVAGSGASENGNLQSMRILIVEDHADTAAVMSRLLTRLGHVCETTDSVASAVEFVRAGNFDVILSDIGLPDASGVELIRQVRTFSNVPAIALSGFGMDEDVSQALDAGFNAHVTKPVNFGRLQSVLREVTQNDTN